MKLSVWLLFLSLCFYITQAGFSQTAFPARGFSPILDVSEAEEKLNVFRDFFFRNQRNPVFHQGYLYQFEFTHYPQTGEPVTHFGLLSGPSPESTTIRIDLTSGKGGTFAHTSFLLKRDSINSTLWKWNKEKELLSDVSAVDWMLPWVKGINHSPFDLLMPFLNWPYQYEKSGRVCGRPAHLYIFTPLPNSPFSQSSFSSVRLAIDDAYHAPLRIEHMDGGILPSRIFSLQSFKKVEDRWVVKTIDVKERDSKSKTRFELISAAHGLDLHEITFEKSGLKNPINQSSIDFQNL
jgi:hypothetical protein